MSASIKRIIPALLFVAYNGQAAADEIEYSVGHEIFDWSFIAVVTPGNFIVDSFDPFTDEPLMSSPHTDKTERDTTVPGRYLHIESAVFNVFVGAIPTDKGWITHTNYVNIKGFAAGLFASNLVMNLTKNIVGRKRPSYESAPDDPDMRKSFFSGHAVNTWYNWTYLSLFVFEHLGDLKNPWHLAGKAAFAAAGGAFASWVCYTRVNDNKHFVSDVVVGGLVGVLFAAGFYAYQNEWLFQVYDRKKEGGKPPASTDISFAFLGNSATMTVKF